MALNRDFEATHPSQLPAYGTKMEDSEFSAMVMLILSLKSGLHDRRASASKF